MRNSLCGGAATSNAEQEGVMKAFQKEEQWLTHLMTYAPSSLVRFVWSHAQLWVLSTNPHDELHCETQRVEHLESKDCHGRRLACNTKRSNSWCCLGKLKL
eukprot:5339801-Amphidinium_carterae.1